jgi:neural Wiskott-Aldrich syndrome protein
MPSSSTLSANDKIRIKSVIPTPAKILAASLARIYFAYPDPLSWNYGGLQGALVLVVDRARGAHFLCLVDLLGTRGVLWEHEIYKDFEYNQDRPFFHSFASDVRATEQLCATFTDTQRAGVHGWYCLPCRG